MNVNACAQNAIAENNVLKNNKKRNHCWSVVGEEFSRDYYKECKSSSDASKKKPLRHYKCTKNDVILTNFHVVRSRL